jgi:hypothetical protein
MADVTAEQVWSGWRGALDNAGYTVSADTERTGDVLNVRGLTLDFDVPDEPDRMTIRLGDIAFVNNDDGTVEMALPDTLPVDITVTPPEGAATELGMSLATTELSVVVSGAPADMTYTYSAASARLGLEELTVEGAPVDMETFGAVEMTVADMAGTTRLIEGEPRRTVQTLDTGAMSYLVDVAPPEGEADRVVMRGGADALEVQAETHLPAEMAAEDMARMLAAGFALDLRVALDGSNIEYSVTEDGAKAMTGSSRSDSSGLRVALDDSRALYHGEAEALDIAAAGGELPLPIEAAAEQTAVTLELPVAAGDTPQDFGLDLRFAGVTVSDMIWGIFDPAENLPRDPATLALDVAGTAMITGSPLDPGDMEALDSPAALPAELRSLSLEDLTVSAVGAELTGAGAFTFDPENRAAFAGMPAPSGEVKLELVGGNTLLDTLVGMGLVPEEQASGVRMMMGLFAVPGEGEDTLTSTIEVKESGQILANGQRIK